MNRKRGYTYTEAGHFSVHRILIKRVTIGDFGFSGREDHHSMEFDAEKKEVSGRNGC